MNLIMAGEPGLKGLREALGTPEGAAVLSGMPKAFCGGFAAWIGSLRKPEAPPGADAVSLEAGLRQALWLLAEKKGCGLRAELKAMRPHPYVIELSERLGLDPYREAGEGFVFFGEAPEDNERLIGFAAGGKERVIRDGKDIRYLTPPERGY